MWPSASAGSISRRASFTTPTSVGDSRARSWPCGPIGIEELGPKLKAVAAARGGMDEPIFVRGDKATEYGSVARVMARIKEAGFKKLSLVTESEAGG